MASLQALREYIDDIRAINSAMCDEAKAFFVAMEESGVTFYNDTDDHRAESLPYIEEHLYWMFSIYKYLQRNSLHNYYSDLWESVSDEYQMSPSEVFHSLVSRSRWVREDVLKVTCPQSALTPLLKSLEDNDLSQFIAAFEMHNIDMSNISKFLSLTDPSQMPDAEDDPDVHSLWLDHICELCNQLNTAVEAKMPKDLRDKAIILQCQWLYKEILPKLPNEKFKDVQLLNTLDLKIHDLLKVLQSPRDYYDKEFTDTLTTLWNYSAKCIIIELHKLPPTIKSIIRQALAPFYLKPIVEKYEKEWEDIINQQNEWANTYKQQQVQQEQEKANSSFSLPEDFFSHYDKGGFSGKDYTPLNPKIKAAGIEKFQKMLLALAYEGYVEMGQLPLLAYRLSGCGEKIFDGEQIVWHKDYNNTSVNF